MSHIRFAVSTAVRMKTHLSLSNVTTKVRGQVGTESFRRFFIDAQKRPISPWHDIPLHTGIEGNYTMVVEIPKLTKSKMEMVLSEEFNPIAQDIKKGKLRDYHGPIYWNYGYFPQTWEDPTVKHPILQAFGDNDPLDVVEIGQRKHNQGDVVVVKVLGALAMIDEGELDWKVLAIDVEDPNAIELQDIHDLATLPGVLSGVIEWFRWYKIPDGKPLNTFGFDERPLDCAQALEVIEETHASWKQLREDDSKKMGLWRGTRN